LIDPTLTAGRWLQPGDENAIVIGNHLTAVRPELKVGDEVTLEIESETSVWKIVGIYRMAGNVAPPIVYTNREYLAELTNTASRIVDLRITTTQHDLLNQRRIARQLETALKQAGVEVGGMQMGAELIASNTQQTDILVYFLLVMAVLIALVGGLGLMSTMSMNVFERTREIGVMRAIGASDGAILQLVLVEGMLIGVISWIFGALLAWPLGQGLATVVGLSMLQSPLDFVFSLDGFIVWLVLVLVISAVASGVPARNASRLTIREVLAYE
jgi:putative ABC transport system permease protein